MKPIEKTEPTELTLWLEKFYKKHKDESKEEFEEWLNK